MRQGNLGALALHRVPTDNARFEDVIGKSWKVVQDRLTPLIAHAELGYLYNLGSMRNRLNSNMLVVGPYGCGKNLFLRALLADPRTIGVKVTLDRLISVWHAQSERNSRKVFELAHEQRVELDKPAVIGFDEFDAVYSGGKNGGVTDSIAERMQKTIQSVLDGDTIYEGVSLLAFTNKPSAIPTPIYRRFAHVEIIQPLDEQERRSILTKMMAGIPCSADFDQAVNWQAILEASEFASGDLLGKIYDHVFRLYLEKLEIAAPEGLKEANKKFEKLALDGKSVGAEQRLEIFSECGAGALITAQDYEKAALALLDTLVIKQAMAQARRFYDLVEQRMEEAFKRVE